MLPTSNASSSSVSERKSLSSLFERHGLTRGPRRLAQDLHKIEDHNEGKMNVEQVWGTSQWTIPYSDSVHAGKPWASRQETQYGKPVLPALCTSPTKTNMRCVASAIQISTIAGNACKENDSIDNCDLW